MDKDLLKRLNEIEEVASTVEDDAIGASLAENDDKLYSLKDIEDERLKNGLKVYNGKLSIRVPRSLHQQLVEEAQREGVSLNQYALYKLSR